MDLRKWVVGVGAIFSFQVSIGWADINLDQGWTAKTKADWHSLSQGSRLLPLSWFVALEAKDSEEKLIPEKGIVHGYPISTITSRYEKLPVPLGFVVDDSDDSKLSFTKLRWFEGQSNKEPWIGLTCAACHTARITYGGKTFQVEGAPTNADFQSFMNDMHAALAQTATQKDKFDRFARRVLGSKLIPANKAKLAGALSQMNEFLTQNAALNETDMLYGPGRLDAVGHIMNRVALVTGAPDPTPNASDAPVSYPFLWNVPQHDKVQWNGIAQNNRLPGRRGLDIGALGRNTGEVIGVFADVRPTKDPGLTGYESSVNVINLETLEKALQSLRPPAWPWPSVPGDLSKDEYRALIAEGKRLFENNCSSCHTPIDRTNLTSPIEAKMSPISNFEGEVIGAKRQMTIRTDPWMACNAFQFETAAGVLVGQKRVDGKGRIKEFDANANMLPVIIKNSLIGKKEKVALLATSGFLGIDLYPEPRRGFFSLAYANLSNMFTSKKQQRLDSCYKAAKETVTKDGEIKQKYEILAYKARPLNGIWATAPYLHNGSVPNLDELLKPSSERKPVFYTGSTEFDPVNVGFVIGQSAENNFLFDTSLDGNSNVGHEYGASTFKEPERRALIEYLKTL